MDKWSHPFRAQHLDSVRGVLAHKQCGPSPEVQQAEYPDACGAVHNQGRTGGVGMTTGVIITYGTRADSDPESTKKNKHLPEKIFQKSTIDGRNIVI